MMKAKYGWTLALVDLLIAFYLVLCAFDILSVNDYVGCTLAMFVMVTAPIGLLIGIGSGMRWNGRKKV
jgi:hypothetical protein